MTRPPDASSTASPLDAGAVLAWGVPRLRDLPWRHTRDPWAILVSEVMLQQTQAARVVDRWDRFLERFPSVDACASAPLAEVLDEWHGLGYPRRAKHLHASARRISELGGFPGDLDGLLALPGIGPYTARAVLAFAFEADVGVVDTNIARVLARVNGRRLTPRDAQSIADASVPAGDGWVWNQCLMDLGATLCRPGRPECAACPLGSTCAWHVDGDPHVDPAEGSSGVSSRQAPFAGSDREARGRLMRALVGGSTVRLHDVARVMGRDAETARRLVDDLAAEGLCEVVGSGVRSPR